MSEAMQITVEQLAGATGCTQIARAIAALPGIQAAMDFFAISDNPERVACFLAEIGEESEGLTYLSEIWGNPPTAAQAGYEGRRDLGNTHPGDGFAFRGSGWLETTGRANFARARDRLRALGVPNVPDFEQHPDLARTPDWAAWLAGLFWDDHQLNVLADVGGQDAFEQITQKINGGQNGELRRWELRQGACRWLGAGP